MGAGIAGGKNHGGYPPVYYCSMILQNVKDEFQDVATWYDGDNPTLHGVCFMNLSRIGMWMICMCLSSACASLPTTTAPLPSATADLPTATAMPPSATPVSATATLPEPTATAEATATITPSMTVTPTSTPTPITYVFPIRNAPVDYGEFHHDYPATDIFADVGSEVVAVTDGVIELVIAVDSWDATSDIPADRSGLAVGLIGDDGVRYYGSHLDAVAPGISVGMRVSAGTLIGYVGKSGNARNTPPHLHFGISRPTTPDDWQTRRGQISPYPFLRAWEAGEQLAPRLADIPMP